MKLDITVFRKMKPEIIKQYTERGEVGVSVYCCLCHVHVLAAYTFLQEEFGGFENSIKNIKEFYRVDIIEG